MAEINNWDDSRKALYLASSLSGNALSVLSELPPTEQRNYSLLVEILRNRYGSEKGAEVFRSQLQTRVKNKNETMTELAQSVRKLTRKAYPGAPQHLIDTLALDHFIDAIPDVDMKLRLREARPKDLNAAESLAVRLESYRLAEQQRGSTLRSTEIERKESSDLAIIKV